MNKMKIVALNVGLFDVDGEDYFGLKDPVFVLGDFLPLDNVVADIAGGGNN